MPEGPEIRLAADRIAKVLVGQTIVDTALAMPPLRLFEERLTGTTVTAIDTRGKAMLTRFDNGLTLYSHNQLYGRWYTARRSNLPKTKRQLRVALFTQTHAALLYSASDIEVLTEDGVADHAFLNRVGPDILDPSLKAENIAERLTDRRFRNRALGSLFLQQEFLAGNGNYLRSEILWAARVNPRLKPSALGAVTIDRIAQQTLAIAHRSYRNRGITASAEEVKERKAHGLSYQKFRFQIYGRDRLPCYRCASPIERHTMSSRSLFVCPVCQDSAKHHEST